MGSGWKMGFFISGIMEEGTTETLFTSKRMGVGGSSLTGKAVFFQSENRCMAQPRGFLGDPRVPQAI